MEPGGATYWPSGSCQTPNLSKLPQSSRDHIPGDIARVRNRDQHSLKGCGKSVRWRVLATQSIESVQYSVQTVLTAIPVRGEVCWYLAAAAIAICN